MEQMSEIKFKLKSYKAISHAISSYEDMRLLLQHLVEGICRTFKVKGSSIFLYDASEKELFRVASHGLSDDYLNKGALFMDEEFKTLISGKTVIIDDLKNSPRIKYCESAAQEGIVSIFTLPIKHKNRVIGLLKNYHTELVSPHEEDLDSLSVLMEQLALVIILNGMKNVVTKIQMAMEDLPPDVMDN